jgi:hypothetical integral membrane protein (TIGR02206 family)
MSFPLTFSFFNTQHLIILFTILALHIIIVFWNFILPAKTQLKRLVIRIMGLLLLGVVISFNYYHLVIMKDFNLSTMLPFHLCSISAYLAIVASVWIEKKFLAEILFFWGYIAALITLFVPDLGSNEGLGSFRFFEMFASHGLIVLISWALIYYHRPVISIKQLGLVLSLLLFYAYFIVLPINSFFEGNYLYFSSKPSGGQMNFLPDGSLYLPAITLFTCGILTVQFFVYNSVLEFLRKRKRL